MRSEEQTPRPSLRDSRFSDEGYNQCRRWFIRLAIGYTIFSAVAAVFTGIIILVLRFAITPQIKAYVEDARLDSFDFATTQTVGTTTSFTCNISVALTVRNTNRAMDIVYAKPLVATFVFYDRRLYNVTVADEGHKHQPRKRERHLLLTGKKVPSNLVLDTAAVQEFAKQKATGVFEVEMRLSGEITIGIGNKRTLALSCPLRLQVSPPGPEVILFHEVICTPDKPEKIYF